MRKDRLPKIKRVYEFYIGKFLFIKDGKFVYPIEVIKFITRNTILIKNLLPTNKRNWKEWKVTLKELRELVIDTVKEKIK